MTQLKINVREPTVRQFLCVLCQRRGGGIRHSRDRALGLFDVGSECDISA